MPAANERRWIGSMSIWSRIPEAFNMPACSARTAQDTGNLERFPPELAMNDSAGRFVERTLPAGRVTHVIRQRITGTCRWRRAVIDERSTRQGRSPIVVAQALALGLPACLCLCCWLALLSMRAQNGFEE